MRKYYSIQYIIIDYQMMTGKLYAIPECAGYTPANMEETLLYKLWFNNESENWKEVYESKEQYMNMPQVKVFEYK